jgi:hypothetical protein
MSASSDIIKRCPEGGRRNTDSRSACTAVRRNSETGGLEDYAKLPAELPIMRKMFDIQPGFMITGCLPRYGLVGE